MKTQFLLASVLALGAFSAPALAGHGHGQPQPIETQVVLTTNTTWDGAPMAYLNTDNPELSVRVIDFRPGAATAWHMHSAPGYIYVVKGSFRVELLDGTAQTWYAGEAFNEVVNTAHFGMNPGPGPAQLVVITPGEIGGDFMTPYPPEE